MESRQLARNPPPPAAGHEPRLDPLIEEAHRELENSRRIAREIIANARREATQIVERARGESENLAAGARSDLEERRRAWDTEVFERNRTAFDQGHAEGLSQGEVEGRRAFDALIQRLASMAGHLERQRQDILRQSQRDIVELILRICERVLRIEAGTRGRALGANLRALLSEIADHDEVIIQVHPTDLGPLTEELARNPLPGTRTVFLEDPAVPAGEARVRGREVNLDLSFARRLEAIRSRLLERLARSPGPEPSRDDPGREELPE